jgi:SAM-dependent methyltransferase
MTSGEVADLSRFLRCPATGAELARVDAAFQTVGGERSYPVVKSVPILIARERSLFDPDSYLTPRPPLSPAAKVKAQIKAWLRRILAMPPTITRNLVAKDNLAQLAELLRGGRTPGARSRVLIVGGASAGVGVELLLDAPDIEVLETDVELTPNVAVVCDGHDLPFVDEMFDAVVCQAVLEHVLEPQRVADEIWRVLKPDGLVYSEVPFMAQVHAGAFDFLRFTHLAHRRMWRRFDEIRSGPDSGPGVALGWSLLYFMRSIAPRSLWPVVNRVVSLMCFWLKYVDVWLVKRPASLDAAYGTFFLGRRRESAVSDRELVRGYRGADAAAPLL